MEEKKEPIKASPKYIIVDSGSEGLSALLLEKIHKEFGNDVEIVTPGEAQAKALDSLMQDKKLDDMIFEIKNTRINLPNAELKAPSYPFGFNEQSNRAKRREQERSLKKKKR